MMFDSSMLTLYTKDNVEELEDSNLAHLAHQLTSAPEELRSSKPVRFSHFPALSLAASLGFKQMVYDATSGGVGFDHYYWIDYNHASLIGQAIAGKAIDYLAIEFTTVATSQCWKILADQAEGATVRQLCISHKSGDEESPDTCAALAHLCTKLKVQKFHLWCLEFETGSVDSFVSCLKDLDNKSLIEVDICDLNKSPPDDEINNVKLEQFVARNRMI